MNDELPKDPISALIEGATAMHEFYSTLVSAGFNQHQALYLTGVALQNGQKSDG